MATLTAQQAVNTQTLQEIAAIGVGDQWSLVGGSPNAPGSDRVEYFHITSPHYPNLHINLLSIAAGDLGFFGGQPTNMTIEYIEVFSSPNQTLSDRMYQIDGLSYQMTDLWNDAGADEHFDIFPAQIFGGDDLFVGSDFGDVLFGFAGNDFISAAAGNDLIDGGDGNDKLSGEDGDDAIYGQAGDDELYGGLGNDSLDGGAGNEIFLRGGARR